MIRLEPDKTRFLDANAEDGDFLIHAVDFSDSRSKQHFLTVWTKHKRPDWSDRWPDHNRDVYHLDPPWIPETFPGKEKEGWSTHYHVNLIAPPTLADLEPFLEHIPPAILEQMQLELSDGR